MPETHNCPEQKEPRYQAGRSNGTDTARQLQEQSGKPYKKCLLFTLSCVESTLPHIWNMIFRRQDMQRLDQTGDLLESLR